MRLALAFALLVAAVNVAAATGFSVGAFDQHVQAHHIRQCGQPVSAVTWIPLHASQRFRRCRIVAHYQVITTTPATSPTTVPTAPIPSSTATSPATAIPPVPTATSPTAPAPSDPQSYELSLMNGARASAGVPLLTLNDVQSNGTASCVGSIGHSQAMAQSGSIWHTNPSYPAASFPDDICTRYLAAGENVGEAETGSIDADLVEDFDLMMAEPHDALTCATTVNHACNILNPRYSSVGIGIVSAGGQTYSTEDFIG